MEWMEVLMEKLDRDIELGLRPEIVPERPARVARFERTPECMGGECLSLGYQPRAGRPFRFARDAR